MRSLRFNFQITLLFADAGFAAEVEKTLETDYPCCRLFIAEIADRRPPFKLAVQVARILAPAL